MLTTLLLLIGTTGPHRPTSPEAAPLILYISPTGSDQATGDSTQTPLRTPQAATRRVRELRALPDNSARPVRVIFFQGTYTLEGPWVLSPEDSGSQAAPITYAASPQAKVTISGGRILPRWTVTERNHKPLWTVKVQPGDGSSKAWQPRELFVGSARRRLAREPNSGYFHVRDIPDAAPNRSWTEGTRSFRYEELDRGAWSKAWSAGAGGECIAFTRWIDMYLTIRPPDTARDVATFLNPTIFLLQPGDPYFLQNRAEFLDAPGEWYMDPECVLSYIPMEGEQPESASAIIPVQARLLDLAGRPEAGRYVENISFEGLSFSHCRWWFGDSGGTGETWPSTEVVGFKQAAWGVPGAVHADGARRIGFNNCEVSHVAGYGIELARGCTENTISRCRITDLGAGGIKIGEALVREPLGEKTTGNTIADSVIEDAGHLHRQAVGIWIGQSAGNTIAHNRITDIAYTGISIGWTWGYGPSAVGGNSVESNEIGFIGRRQTDAEPVLGDMGGIYTLGGQPGTVIRGNYFHDIAGRSIAWGIYFDEGSAGIVAENNLVMRTTHGSFHQHYGKDNILRNNIFCFGKEAQLWRTRNEDHTSFTLMHNIILAENDRLLAGDWSANYLSDHNLFWRVDGAPPGFPGGKTLAQWQAEGHETGSVTADPRVDLSDPLRPRIPSDSPARAVGFAPFDLSGVGPR